jgi:RNA polymerase sigma factor (sigma-70 family)
MVNAQIGSVLHHLRKMTHTHACEAASDAELLERFLAQREEPAFVALLQRHGPMVLQVCRRIQGNEHDAEDAFQATFLLLARKAGSIRKRDSVASWLHGVAHRLALEAKGQGARRQARERRAADMHKTSSVPDKAWQELQILLDEALAQVPEKYRTPLLLCYLQGKTQEEAARQLGCPIGTLRSRVARGRTHLKGLIEKRGVRLSATALAAALMTSEGLGAVPTPLLHATARAALGYAAGIAPTALVSARTSALLETATRSLFASKLKVVCILMVAISACAGGVGIFGRQLSSASEGGPPPAAMTKPPQSADKQAGARPEDGAIPSAGSRASTAPVEIQGRVLDPNGQPLANAKIYYALYGQHFSPPAWMRTDQMISRPDGTFRFSVPGSDFAMIEKDVSWSHAILAAAAPGYGPGWLDFSTPQQARDLTLRLVKDDVPVEGRLVSLEGRPVPGVTVTISGLEAVVDEDLTAWLNTAQSKPDQRWVLEKARLFPAPPFLPKNTVTDADGRFRFKGIGRERIVTLDLQGPGITAHRQDIHVLSRAVKPFHLLLNSKIPEIGRISFYGTGCDIAVAPTKPIVGTVMDKDSGKPMPGVTIQSMHVAGRGTLVEDFLRTTTDEQGRYRLLGMPKGAGNAILAIPAAGEPYFAAQKQVDDSPGLDPVQVDFHLKRGIWIRGRVTDKKTGAPVRADVRYGVFLTNPQRTNVPSYSGDDRSAKTGADGSFQVLGMPGRGVLGIKADEDRFLAGQGIDLIPPENKLTTNFVTVLSNPPLTPDQYHAFVQVNPPADSDKVYEAALDPGRTISGTVTDSDGKPLSGAQMTDLKLMWSNQPPLADSHFTATALDPAHPRWLFFRHHERQLGAALEVRGDESKSFTVRLQPCGTVTGRLLDARGKPWPGRSVYGSSKASYMSVTNLRWWSDYVSAHTDQEGRFKFEGLIPGVEYRIAVGEHTHNLTLAPSETKDLGDVKN